MSKCFFSTSFLFVRLRSLIRYLSSSISSQVTTGKTTFVSNFSLVLVIFYRRFSRRKLSLFFFRLTVVWQFSFGCLFFREKLDVISSFYSHMMQPVVQTVSGNQCVVWEAFIDPVRGSKRLRQYSVSQVLNFNRFKSRNSFHGSGRRLR